MTLYEDVTLCHLDGFIKQDKELEVEFPLESVSLAWRQEDWHEDH